MRPGPANLAIETSSRHGSVSVGAGDQLLASAVLPPPRRQRVDLLPTIDGLFRQQDLAPAALQQVYVNVGPGSFTGLRIAMATVQALALVQPLQVAALCSLDVLAGNLPPDTPGPVFIGVNQKADTIYGRLFASHPTSDWHATTPAGLHTAADILALQPASILAEMLPTEGTGCDELAQVKRLNAELTTPRSEVLWRLGQAAAARQQWVEVRQLLPVYARAPEAVRLWEQRQQRSAGS